jgi:hypothetical protein
MKKIPNLKILTISAESPDHCHPYQKIGKFSTFIRKDLIVRN